MKSEEWMDPHQQEVVVQVLSWFSFLLVLCVLLPQVHHNIQRQSTQGLSTAMMVLFLWGSIVPAVYALYTHEPWAIVWGWIGFAGITIFILCQIRYYNINEADAGDTNSSSPPHNHNHNRTQRRRNFVMHYIIILSMSVAADATLYFIFLASDAANAPFVPELIGFILPVIANVAGYLVQIRLIVKGKDATGISPLFILIDLIGCSVSIVSIALSHFDSTAVAPFFAIIGCQLVMAFLYYVIYPYHARKDKDQLQQDRHLSSSARINHGEQEQQKELNSSSGPGAVNIELQYRVYDAPAQFDSDFLTTSA